MKVFVCIDDAGGMLFGGKRQSRDRLLIEDVRRTAEGGRLIVPPFSESLFKKEGGYLLADDPFVMAEVGDYCFVEHLPLSPVKDKIDTLYIYKWNRRYPASTYLDVDPTACGMHLVSTEELVGSSHEKITKETYER